MVHPKIHPRSALGKRVRRQSTDYKVACLVPLGVELAPLRAMLDEIHDNVPVSCNQNAYTLGSIGQHNMVIATLPSIGNNDSGVVANQLKHDFPSVQFSILVGIAGGIPNAEKSIDIRLGDVVVSEPNGLSGGVLQFDRGKRNTGDRLELVGHLNKPPQFLTATVKSLKAQHLQQGHKIKQLVSDMLRRFPRMKKEYDYPGSDHDQLYPSDYYHVEGDACRSCVVTESINRVRRDDDQIMIHYGTIGSSNAVIRDSTERDRLGRDHNILSVEMEAAGLMDTLPSLVVRGICDYADSHKNKHWQPYAAATAAAYVKELVLSMSPERLMSNAPSSDPNTTVEERSLNVSAGLDVIPKPEIGPESSQLEVLIESLTFDQMDARLQNITEALPKTCKWLFRRVDFQDWSLRRRVEEHHGFFWIKGKPGSGKSTMMKTALKWARRRWRHEMVMSYFFNARASGELEKSSLGFYRSLAHQILHAYPGIRSLFLDQFKNKVRNNAIVKWTVSELQNFLQISIQVLQDKPLNIFIDALDEGQEDDIRELVAFLEDLALHAAFSDTDLRICLSSRHFPHISVKKELSLIMEEQPGHKEDIELYILTKLSGGTSTEMVILRDRVLEKSANVFLWVVLVVRLLNKAYDKGKSVGHMMRCLEDIPIHLDELFARILAQSNEELGECLSLLQWVSFARQGLSPVQLDLAVKSSLVPTKCHSSEISPERLKWYLLNTSRGLIEVTKSNPPTVQFIHETVRDFLTRKGLAQIDASIAENIEGRSHDKLKSSCLQYVTHYAKSAPMASSSSYEENKSNIMQALPFMEYAVEHVFRHAEMAERHTISQRRFLRSIKQNNWVLSTWVELHNAFRKFKTQRFQPTVHLLYIIVNQGLENLAKVLLNDDSDGMIFVAEGERYGNVLQAACAFGSEDIVSRLLNAGADVNIEGGTFKHAILAAIHYKRDRVIRLMIQHGARPRKAVLSTAFFAVVTRSYLAGIETFLELGADIEQRNSRGETPLYIAASANHIDVVKLLICRGANVRARCKPKGTALQAACYKGNHAIAELLLSKGADSSAISDSLHTSIQLARQEDHLAIVELLLAKGADPNAVSDSMDTGLQVACRNGHLTLAEMLLSKGADPNLTIDFRQSPLQLACCNNNQAIVELLLSNGADVNFQSVYGGRATALQIACREGNRAIVELLLSQGADVNVQCGFFNTALQAACFEGHKSVVKMLLSKGADVNAQGGICGTALQAACSTCNQEVVELLLAEGINVNAHGGHHGSPLAAACSKGNLTIVKLLLSRGADVNARTEKYGSALDIAHNRGDSHLIQLLEEAGATL